MDLINLMSKAEAYAPDEIQNIFFSTHDEIFSRKGHRCRTPKPGFVSNQVFCPRSSFFDSAPGENIFASPIPLKKIGSGPDEKNPGHASGLRIYMD